MRSTPGNLLKDPSFAFLVPDLIPPEVATCLFDRMFSEVKWQEREIVLFGKRMLQPRLVAWQGDPGKSYRYSGSTWEPDPWSPSVLEIRNRIEEWFHEKMDQRGGASFNGVLLNLYRSGSDSMGWHRDNEPELGPEPLIASVSLGAVRRFVLRNREHPERKHVLELPHGSLLVMGGATQRDWEHSLPKSARVQGARINLTFRRL